MQIKVDDEIKRLAEKIGGDMLYLIPGSLRDRSEYLERKYGIRVPYNSYDYQWRRLVSQLGLEKAIELLVKDFAKQTPQEAIEKLKEAVDRPLTEEERSRFELWFFCDWETGKINDLGRLVLKCLEIPEKEIVPEIRLEREEEERIYELKLGSLYIRARETDPFHRNMQEMVRYILHREYKTPLSRVKLEYRTIAPGWEIRLDVYDTEKLIGAEVLTDYNRHRVSGWVDDMRACKKSGIINEAWLVIPSVELLGDHQKHLNECLEELRKAGIKYRVLDFSDVFRKLEEYGCKPKFRIKGYSIELLYTVP